MSSHLMNPNCPYYRPKARLKESLDTDGLESGSLIARVQAISCRGFGVFKPFLIREQKRHKISGEFLADAPDFAKAPALLFSQ